MEFFDDFFLTKGLATPALRAKVEAMRDQIYGLERQYQAEYAAFIGVESDLAMMEQKAVFVQDQLERTLAILSPPGESEMEGVYDILERYVHDPLNYVATGMMGVGSLMFLVGKVGGRISGGGRLGKPGAKAGAKAGEKAGAGVGRSLKAMSRTRSISAAAGTVTKATKWTKVAKVGSKLGAIGLVIAAVDFGLALATAHEMNAHFKKQAGAMRKNIKEAEKAIAALSEQVKAGRAAIETLLQKSDVGSVEEFVQQLNEAIADLGQKSASAGVARRMLLDGFIPADRILAYVPALPPEALAELQKKLQCETRLLAGTAVAAVAEALGLSLAKVSLIAQLQTARAMLLAGASIAEAASTSGAPENLVAGEDDTLQQDLQALWPQIERGAAAPEALARLLLVPVPAVALLHLQLDAKQRLHEGESADAIARTLDLPMAQISGWQEDLADAAKLLAGLASATGLKPQDTQLAADHLLSLALVGALLGRSND